MSDNLMIIIFFNWVQGQSLNIFSPGASWAPKHFFTGAQPVFMPININLIRNIVIFFLISSTQKGHDYDYDK
jgi:hypothetical protein